VASIAIYEAVEMMDYRQAGLIALSFIPVSYAFLLLINKLNREVDS
jgi:molybdate transport system permease protein